MFIDMSVTCNLYVLLNFMIKLYHVQYIMVLCMFRYMCIVTRLCLHVIHNLTSKDDHMFRIRDLKNYEMRNTHTE